MEPTDIGYDLGDSVGGERERNQKGLNFSSLKYFFGEDAFSQIFFHNFNNLLRVMTYNLNNWISVTHILKAIDIVCSMSMFL